MHPFSLQKEQSSQVTGGSVADGFVSSALRENGGPIMVTMAIPEDGSDPRDFKIM
ncbi:hypothetical protein [Pseudoalteromonas xiamenensis]|uniref:Uncharacterized protein n=1 Tax=Pseudoalteromonas xiamenensis TaxID=882626 RepID=A0A975HJW0_9GAMM|nr:hypothetical protein [Pseudoalteromonas xiamenensis]QTH70329.1 hypothetical protein J5O05_09890 [Pseudoalteromonas xiamenensis]WMN58596.1 hypothetical protein NI389_10030 [Pseudoalteromonas xiamenensis]